MESFGILQELYARYVAKSPKLFRIITNISLICVFITGLPEMLELLNIELPENISFIKNKVILVASIVSALISKLTVDTPEATSLVLKKMLNK